MSVKVLPIQPGFVASLSGVDLKVPLKESTRRSIEQASAEYAVLVFRDQPLSENQQVAFASALGALDTLLRNDLTAQLKERFRHEAIIDVSNVDASGQAVDRSEEKALLSIGNRLWHSDGLGRHIPFRYSILAAQFTVSWGGETQFADLRAAYDALDAQTLQFIQDRIGVFSFLHPRRLLGIDVSQAEEAAFPAVRWPLVRIHPQSARKLLWVDSKLCDISGLGRPEARALALELLEHATQRERVYSHAWQVNDVVMWDNRLVLHRGRRFDLSERRDMRRVSTLDDVASLGYAPQTPMIPDAVLKLDGSAARTT